MKDFSKFQVGYALISKDFEGTRVKASSVMSWEDIEEKSNNPVYAGHLIAKTTYPYPFYETEKLTDMYGNVSYVENKYYVIKEIVGQV